MLQMVSGKVTNGAHWLRVTVSGVAPNSDPAEAYIDNISLSILN